LLELLEVAADRCELIADRIEFLVDDVTEDGAHVVLRCETFRPPLVVMRSAMNASISPTSCVWSSFRFPPAIIVRVQIAMVRSKNVPVALPIRETRELLFNGSH
jgi:hypothetical protein